jgi:hypothetical protein
MTSEVEQENSFLQRIKNKIKILQMYSSSPGNDLFYVGSSFDSSDYVDFARTNNSSLIPLIESGQMTLSTKATSSWSISRVYIDEQNSNGYAGNNHSAYQYAGEEENYKYFFKDFPTSRNLSNVTDNNPTSFFEYEQINIPTKTTGYKNFEFNYAKPGGVNLPIQYSDWSSFSSDGKLKLTIVMENDSEDKANFINITPYFGSNGYISKDVVVSKVEIKNDKDEIENVLPYPIYISSGFIPSSLDSSRNFYYREAKIKFNERKIKSIKIYFEQESYTDTKIKHVYFKPYIRQSNTTSANSVNVNPYYNQNRFDPESPLLSPDYGYPTIAWSDKVYNISQIVPLYNQPNLFKAETSNTIDMSLILKRNIPIKSGWSVRATGTDGKTYYITNQFRSQFNYEPESNPSYFLVGFSGVTNETYRSYITEAYPNAGLSSLDGWISNATETTGGTESSEAQRTATQIVNWFNGSSQNSTSAAKYGKFSLVPNSAVAFQSDTQQTKVQSKSFTVALERKFEILNGQRKSISLRDINVGYEEYADKAEMISRSFDFNYPIEYLTLSSDVAFSGNIQSNQFSNYINYYISMQEGQWIQVSPIENPLSQVGEVLAFNQNIENTFKIPGVEYYNYPAIPENPNSISVKIEIQKPVDQNITPIVYSYKLGIKVKQV